MWTVKKWAQRILPFLLSRHCFSSHSFHSSFASFFFSFFRSYFLLLSCPLFTVSPFGTKGLKPVSYPVSFHPFLPCLPCIWSRIPWTRRAAQSPQWWWQPARRSAGTQVGGLEQSGSGPQPAPAQPVATQCWSRTIWVGGYDWGVYIHIYESVCKHMSECMHVYVQYIRMHIQYIPMHAYIPCKYVYINIYLGVCKKDLDIPAYYTRCAKVERPRLPLSG